MLAGCDSAMRSMLRNIFKIFIMLQSVIRISLCFLSSLLSLPFLSSQPTVPSSVPSPDPLFPALFHCSQPWSTVPSSLFPALIHSYSAYTLQTSPSWATRSRFPLSDGWFSALPPLSRAPIGVHYNKVRSESFMRPLIVLISALQCRPDPKQEAALPDWTLLSFHISHVRDEELMVCFHLYCNVYLSAAGCGVFMWPLEGAAG